jgi:hypothetical protein
VHLSSGYHANVTYRLADPIENMKLEVTLRKRGTHGERRVRDAAASDKTAKKERQVREPRRRRSRRRGDEDGDEEEEQEAEAEAAGGSMQPLRSEEEEEDQVIANAVFHWQEKVFSPSEVSEVRKDTRRAKRGGEGGLLALLGLSRKADDFVRVRRREVLAQYDVDAQARDGEGQLYSGHVLHSRAGWSQSDAACAA